MASTKVSRDYGGWKVTTTRKDGGTAEAGHLWVTVTPAASVSAAAAAARGYSEWPVMGTAEDPTAASAAVAAGEGATKGADERAFAFDASLIRGWPFAPWLQPARWERLAGAGGAGGAGVGLRASDVVVATYPKSGTTLAEQAILLFLAGGDASLLAPADKNALGRRDPKDAKFCKVRHPIYYTTASVPLFSP